jgi:hypothetical protein
MWPVRYFFVLMEKGGQYILTVPPPLDLRHGLLLFIVGWPGLELDTSLFRYHIELHGPVCLPKSPN